MGVPVVCRLGPGVPLRAHGAGRSRVCQATAHSDVARVVHAPERATSGVRVEVGGCESSGTRVGCLAGLQNRKKARGQRRSRISGARVPEVVPEFYMVGEPEGW